MRHLLTLAAAFALTGPAVAQIYVPVASESFDYTAGIGLGGQDGGDGWFNAWWSGFGEDNSVVTMPGIDAVGGKLTTNIENEGSFRLPETGPHPDLAPDFRFGSGDGVQWISLMSQKPAGSTDEYGGFSLNEQFVGEKLYIGAIFGTGEWGLGDPVGGQSVTVPGSDVTQLTNLVVKITFTQTGETVDMWLNPASAHPTTTPDATLSVAEIIWNEVRFQSGVNNGGMTGWDFDNLVIEKEATPLGTNYCSTNPNSTGMSGAITAIGSDIAADNNFSLVSSNLPSGQFAYYIGSQTQGFIANPGNSEGNLCVAGDIARFNTQIGQIDAGGQFEISVDLTDVPEPPSLSVMVMAGETWNFQCWHRDTNPMGPTSNFTDGVSVLFN